VIAQVQLGANDVHRRIREIFDAAGVVDLARGLGLET